MKCSVCKKKDIKFGIFTNGAPSKLWYGFCSKVCIANRSIYHHNIKVIKNGENNDM